MEKPYCTAEKTGFPRVSYKSIASLIWAVVRKGAVGNAKIKTPPLLSNIFLFSFLR